MDNRCDLLFFELLRSALWSRPAREELFRQIDGSVWREIVRLSDRQKVTALIYEGVVSLPEACRPERQTVYKLFLHAEAVAQSNEKLNRELRNLSAEYEKIDCPWVLLKGASNALLYPNPQRRTAGDIDLFFYRKGDYRKANRWVKSRGYKTEEENIHHLGFHINGVHVENHKSIAYFGIRKYDRLFEKEVRGMVLNERFVSVDIDGLSVRILPVEFNAFFIFYHLFHHFIHLGVGLRQLCDWMLFMHVHAGQMNKEEFMRLMELFDLSEAAKIFASVVVKYLGADPGTFPFEIDLNGKYVDLVMEDVLRGGNFGYSFFKGKNFRNRWHRKWHTFKYTTGRMRRIEEIAPRHIKSLPLSKIVTNLKILLKN